MGDGERDVLEGPLVDIGTLAVLMPLWGDSDLCGGLDVHEGPHASVGKLAVATPPIGDTDLGVGMATRGDRDELAGNFPVFSKSTCCGGDFDLAPSRGITHSLDGETIGIGSDANAEAAL